jgi:hypothetical protein
MGFETMATHAALSVIALYFVVVGLNHLTLRLSTVAGSLAARCATPRAPRAAS